ncbi:hypothetical protein KCP70_21930 [Salmonella enterica subsp. enterica]|nr:hypothetical protein KCP70_21930 [Salmonella enterica subsp. enterica]
MIHHLTARVTLNPWPLAMTAILVDRFDAPGLKRTIIVSCTGCPGEIAQTDGILNLTDIRVTVRGGN